MIDHFALFGIPRTFEPHPEELETRFHTLQKASHPDKFTGSSENQLSNAQDTSAAINDAYRTLRDPLRRLRYMLSLYGYSVHDGKQIPSSLLMSVMEAQETIGELEFATDVHQVARLKQQVQQVFDTFRARMAALEAQRLRLTRGWDTASHAKRPEELSDAEKGTLQALTAILTERAYIQTLMLSLEAAMRGESAVIKH